MPGPIKSGRIKDAKFKC